jgi:RND family efflux transporter MFP subunit
MYRRPLPLCLSCIFLVLTTLTVLAEDPPAQAPEVPVARPVTREVTDHEDFTGRTEAVSRVDLRARVTGYLLKSLFQEGADVKQGEVLFEIDPRPYRAELDKSEAALAQAEARVRLAQANHKRIAAAVAQKLASQEDLDKAVAERAEAEAGMQAARAGRELAKLNMEYTRVTSPISGQVGRQLIDPGNLVIQDQTMLAVIVSREPMYVYFDVDERTFLHLRRAANEGKIKTEKLPVAIGLAGEEDFSRKGVVDFANNTVNTQTGTLQLRAVLPNKDKLLVPGMFVRVRLALGEPSKALLIPESAVLTDGGTKYVFIVTDKNAVDRRTVTLGQQVQGRRVVLKGLRPDDVVVVGRHSGLQPGTVVRPKEASPEDKEPERPREREGGRGASAVPSSSSGVGAGIVVDAVYSGASAAVVADTVRAPIEQQVGGLEKLRLMRSRCTKDGKYALALTFERGMDPKWMQVLVQNRVNVAVPVLPDRVKEGAISILRGAAGIQAIVTLGSPGGRYDSLYLSNYADIQLKDELSRLAGVSSVVQVGRSEYALRIRLDMNKLAARGLSPSEVVRALEKKKDSRENKPEDWADLVLKAAEGQQIYLRDVAAVELGASEQGSQATFNGKPVTALVIYTNGDVRPRTLRAALGERLAQLRERLPEGLDLDAAFDFSANLEAPDRPPASEYLLLDLDVPAAASVERIEKSQQRCLAKVREVPGVQHVLSLSQNPFDLFGGAPCLLVLLSPAQDRKTGREDIIRTIRTRTAEIKELTVRVRDLAVPDSFPRCGYPIDLAVRGPEMERVREWAKKLAARLSQESKLADVWVNPSGALQPQRFVDIDRTKAAALGVSAEEIFNTLQIYEGSLYFNDFNRFGRTWSVIVQAEAARQERDMTKLQIRNSRGYMVPLGTLVTIRETEAPTTLDYLDGNPMVEITANLKAGASAEELRKHLDSQAEKVRKELGLSAAYRLIWLGSGPK